MNESLDVFISYRRETGADAAMALYYALKEKGYKVFIDVHTLRAGTFDDKLLGYIENARNVLVVLTAGSLDRCANADDWLRREVEYAFEKGCRVIPVMKPDFRFPPVDSLPEKLRALPRHHGIPYSHDLFDGTMDQICRFLDASVPVPTPEEKRPVQPSEPSLERRKAGDAMTVKLPDGVPLELVWCPPGTFWMGSPKSEEGRSDGETRHRVTLTKGFWIGKYPVTQRQWLAVMGDEPPERFGFPGNGEHPAEKVSWDDICKSRDGFLAELNGLGLAGSGVFRLPTAAEWEYACRAGTTGPYNVDGAALGDLGWYDKNSGGKTHPVGQKRSNAWGIQDMHGNVWEWCQDWHGGYPSGSVTDPGGAASGSGRVYRGGGWGGSANDCRSAYRRSSTPYYRNGSIGFRAAMTLP